MNERNDTFENELTEENLPEPQEREDVAEDLKEDPGVNSAEDDATMEGNDFGMDRPAPRGQGVRNDG
jgi:hypothetical protein